MFTSVCARLSHCIVYSWSHLIFVILNTSKMLCDITNTHIWIGWGSVNGGVSLWACESFVAAFTRPQVSHLPTSHKSPHWYSSEGDPLRMLSLPSMKHRAAASKNSTPVTVLMNEQQNWNSRKVMYESLSGAFSVRNQKLLRLIKTYKVSFCAETHWRNLCDLLDVEGCSFWNAAEGNGARFQAGRRTTSHFA